MSENAPQDNEVLAASLLDIAPRLLRQVTAKIPLEGESLDNTPGLREISELRATPGQLSLLSVLVERERCMMQELAEHLAVTPSTVTAMVKRLLASGYIERSRDELDWRAVWIKPTPHGYEVVSLFNAARLAILRGRLDRLSEDDRTALISALPALRNLSDL